MFSLIYCQIKKLMSLEENEVDDDGNEDDVADSNDAVGERMRNIPGEAFINMMRTLRPVMHKSMF